MEKQKSCREKRRFVRLAVAVVLAAAVSAVTAILPLVASVGKLVYANNVPVILMSMEAGPLGGVLYAAAASAVLNNLGMGSGVILYVLLYQMIEAALLGVIWHRKKFGLIRYLLTVFGGGAALKPLSFLLYYLFNSQTAGERGLGEYMLQSTASYWKTGLTDALLLYATGILCGYLLHCGIGRAFQGRPENEKRKACF